MSTEGYDVEVIGSTSHDMYCVICLKLMRDAIQMHCGHGMCDTCFHKLGKFAKSRNVPLVCPSCRTEIIEEKVFQVPMIDRIILAIQVRCENFKLGCEWIGELGDMQMHINANCQFPSDAEAASANVNLETFTRIVPKHKSKGADFCATDGKFYIIRPDLGYYLRSTNFHQGHDIVTYKLHSNCRGTHYLATSGKFYIIHGDKYRRVTNMNSDKSATSYSLHPNCQAGDMYTSIGSQFIIIFFETRMCHFTTNMNNDNDAYDVAIPDGMKDGMYYWSSNDKSYCLKQSGSDVQYHKYNGFDGKINDSYHFHRNIMCFIPGGLAVVFGNSLGAWKRIHSERNTSEASISWSSMVDRKDGFDYKEFKLSDYGFDLCSKAVRAQFLYDFKEDEFLIRHLKGGCWHDVQDVKESVRARLKANEEVHIWQYVIGFKDAVNVVLYTHFIAFTDIDEEPTQDVLYTL